MNNAKIKFLLIVEPGGVPLYTLTLDTEENSTDIILISGFVAAFSQFLSSILSSEGEILQFAQKDYEGIIDEVNEYYFTIIGENLFPFEPIIFKTLFNFINEYYLVKEEKQLKGDESSLSELITSIFVTHSNADLYVPSKNANFPYLFDNNIETVYNALDGMKNITELSFSCNYSDQLVHTLIRILAWQKVVDLRLELRDYLIFRKTAKCMVFEEQYNEHYMQLEEFFPRSLELLNFINGKRNVKDLKDLMKMVDILPEISVLVENELIETISKMNVVQVIIYDYLVALNREIQKSISSKNTISLLKELLKEQKNPFSHIIKENIVNDFEISQILENLQILGYSHDEILKLFSKPIANIQSKLKEIDKEKTPKIFGTVFEEILNRHSFTLERMNVLELLCPEEFLK